MPDIQFDEPQYAKSQAPIEKPSWLSNLVIKCGLAKDAAGAQKVLVIVLVVVLALIVWINWPASAPEIEPIIESPEFGP